MFGACLKLLGFVAVALAISIGAVGKCAPHLFLRIPKVGFIPWAITGNHMPPNFDPSVYEDGRYQRFMKDGDIVMASGAKAGTMWLAHILYALRNGGEDDFNYVVDTLGTVETLTYPWQSFEERIAKSEVNFQKLPSNMSLKRIWFSHSSPNEKLKGLNPSLNKHIKYILIVRNGMEVTRSFQTFLNSFTDEMKAMWGGFPPAMEPEEALKFVTQDQPHFFFEYNKDWWQYRNEPNVLLLHYANLRSDLSAVLTQIAQFLELPLTKEVRQKVMHKVSLAYMKTKPERTCARHAYPGQPEFCHTNEHLQSGKSDKGKGFFTDEMLNKWSEYETKYFGHDPALRKWVAEGGPLP